MTTSQETRISLVEQDLTRTRESIEKLEDTMSKHREESSTSTDRIYDRMEELRQEIKQDLQGLDSRFTDQIDKQNETLNRIDSKLSDIDKWRWLVIGAATILGFIITQLASIFGWTINRQ